MYNSIPLIWVVLIDYWKLCKLNFLLGCNISQHHTNLVSVALHPSMYQSLLWPTIHIFLLHPTGHNHHGRTMVVCMLQILQREMHAAQVTTDLILTFAMLNGGWKTSNKNSSPFWPISSPPFNSKSVCSSSSFCKSASPMSKWEWSWRTACTTMPYTHRWGM